MPEETHPVYRAGYAAGLIDCERVMKAEIERLFAEREAVIDCVNLYGDEILHRALTDAGLLGSRDA